MDKHSFKTMSAHEIAGESYSDKVYSFTSSGFYWECMGYSKSGNSVKFGRVETTKKGLRAIYKYVNPDKQIFVWKS